MRSKPVRSYAAQQKFIGVFAIVPCMTLSCMTEVGPQGAQGPQGVPGPTITPCPDGYMQDPNVTNFTLCKNGADEMVRVGTGRTSFWIDRYEASVWQNADGSGTQYGATGADYPATFPQNGQATTPLYALGKVNAAPSAFISWFQANEVCRSSGKRLPTGPEWLAAARGTLDPGDSSGSGGACVTNAPNTRNTGGGTKCVSDWGAQDMVGNLWEWNEEWLAGVGNLGAATPPWPVQYGKDGTYNIASTATYGSANQGQVGLPSAVIRGGSAVDGIGAGIFAFSLSDSPITVLGNHGFRCVIPR